MSTLAARIDRLRPRGDTEFWMAVALTVELVALVAYLLVGRGRITDPVVAIVYPLVWINVGLWAMLSTTPPPRSGRYRYAGIAVGVAYFGVLAYVGGLVSPGHLLHGHAHGGGLSVTWRLPPGWAPTLMYATPLVQVTLVPFKAIGYLALSYLVYATVMDAAGSAISGVVGLFSCVSCTWPVVGTVVTGVLGGSSAVAAFATNQPYAASTVVFLSAVALLAWRPLR